MSGKIGDGTYLYFPIIWAYHLAGIASPAQAVLGNFLLFFWRKFLFLLGDVGQALGPYKRVLSQRPTWARSLAGSTVDAVNGFPSGWNYRQVGNDLPNDAPGTVLGMDEQTVVPYHS